MDSPVLIKNRYEIKNVLGRGGMGVVYKAFDTLMQREVALKTLRDLANEVSVDLFYRECTVLTAMVHPNIVEIFDMGEFEEDGGLKPYFVMPLLPGRTLYDLIYPAAAPLPPERCADIIGQACRGLHAAHECGLLHRDIKPRNIFVMRDDAVKLIDFGVVRLLSGQTNRPGAFGTLHYMAPEQIAMEPLTTRSDIFSLATVCYEALTAVHPFVRENDAETATAVAEHDPPLACSLNPLVGKPLAQVVAQAMAKDPANRFESAAAFADALQRGLRNERTGAVILNNPQNRLARARRSFARGDYEFTGEILEQLETEGVNDGEVRELRAQVNDAARKREEELQLAAARRYFQEEEYTLALRRVSDVLGASPSNPAAVSLKNQIERKLNEQHAADSLTRAAEHLDLEDFVEARRVIQDLMKTQPNNGDAKRLLAETAQQERDWPRERQEQQALFEAAREAHSQGLIEIAFGSLKELMEVTRRSKAAGQRIQDSQDFYKSVRAEHEAFRATLADARKLLANGDLDGAGLLYERLRERYGKDEAMLALNNDVAARRLERDEEYRRDVCQRISAEPDLDVQLRILNQAARSQPNDDYFRTERQRVQAKLEQVADFAARAQAYEASTNFDHALEEWLCVGDSYPAFPGLPEHLARVRALWQRQRERALDELNSIVVDALRQGDQKRAEQLLSAARAEFQDEAGYGQIQRRLQAAADAQRDVTLLLGSIQKAEGAGRLGEIPGLFQKAIASGKEIQPLHARVLSVMTASATRVLPHDWRVARQLVEEIGRLAAVPPELIEAIRRQEREEEVSSILAENRAGVADLEAYHERVGQLLAKYPDELRLEERLHLLDGALAEKRKQDEKNACAAALVRLDGELAEATDHRLLWDVHTHAKNLAGPFSEDPAIVDLVDEIGQQVVLFEKAAEYLSRDHLGDCFEICSRALARRPGHRLFQQLKDQAADRRRELGEEYFDRVERWLASEPGLLERQQILERAQEQYPFDTRYAEQLQQIEHEKALAETLGIRAHDLQKRGLIADALGQWRQLRNIHPSYPGLEKQIDTCESTLNRQHRKALAQRLFSQGQEHFANGEFDQGYEMLAEAARNGQDISELLRPVAPELIAAARIVLPDSPKLAAALVALALQLDEELHVPKDFQAKVSEARKTEYLAERLNAIHSHQNSGDFGSALALADEFLAEFPGVKEIECVRDRSLVEIERARKQLLLTQVLADFEELENRAATATALELLDLKGMVREIVGRNPEDEKVTQPGSTLDEILTALADARAHLQTGAATDAEEVCVKALEKFPEHPLLSAARAEAATQKGESAVKLAAQVKERLAAENDFSKQSTIVQEALAQCPDEAYLTDELAAVGAKQRELNAFIENARALEGKQSFGEALREWETIRKNYPWYAGAEAEIERLSSARRKEKHDAHDRWFRQVEDAIAKGDYETASTMIRQAQQQQPDRALQGLDQKLKDAQRKKEESDTQFAEGKRLLSNGDLVHGGQALYRAFELQPNDKEKTDSIILLLQMQIRANVTNDFAAWDGLLSLLNRIQPGHVLGVDLNEAVSRKQKVTDAGRERSLKMLDQIADLSKEAVVARSKKALSSVAEKINAGWFLNSSEAEVRRAASDLLRRINLHLSQLEETQRPRGRASSMSALAAAALVAVMIAGATVFILQFREQSVPFKVSVTPDNSTIEIGGQECQSAECTFRLKPGQYVVHIQKAGYKPRSVFVSVKSGDSTPLKLNAALEPLSASVSESNPLARVEIHGALPGTRIKLDGDDIGAASDDGTFLLRVEPGTHTLDLSLEGFSDRTIKRDFVRGETVSLVDAAVQLQKKRRSVQ